MTRCGTHGEVREYAATFGDAPVAKFTYERDPVGRISKVTETRSAGGRRSSTTPMMPWAASRR
ncbi:MAG: hypothetical protein WA208_15040 [Thermoanaerobaculia bacterium]